MSGRGRAIGLAAGAAWAAAAAAGVGHVLWSSNSRRVRRLLKTVPEHFHTPILFLLDREYDGKPPKRDSRLEGLIAKAVPTGLGQPMTIPGRDGEPGVPAYIYDPPGRRRPSGAVLWIHGGGMIAGAPWMDHAICTRIAREHGLLVISVDYRLAPEHPFPAGPEDCFTGLLWLHERATLLGVDPSKIAVGGESAGGGLSAMVAQMAHDRGVDLAFQALVYPMIDDRTALRDDHGDKGLLVWTSAKNKDAWGWFLGHPVGEEEDRPYAVPSRRADLSGLAPAWIGIGDKDLFHDEDVEYARRLEEAGVPVELVVVPGMYHAADILQSVPEMREFRNSLIAAIGRAVAR